jgi:hypothetical protein
MSVRLHPTKNKNLKLAGVPGITMISFVKGKTEISLNLPD